MDKIWVCQMALHDFEIFDIFHFASRTVCVFHGKETKSVK